MTRPRLLIVLLTATVACAVPALAAEKTDTNKKKAPPDAPKGWIVLEENFWLPLAHEPGTYFHRAHEEFLTGEYDLAAIDLRQASAFLRLQARRSTYAEHSSVLFAAANRLSNLAYEVERKQVKRAAKLDREFARAHYALAEHDYVMAKESWNKEDASTTGHNIDAAVFNLESGYNWANAELDSSAFDAAADARALAEELVTDGPRSMEVSATLDAVHGAIKSLATRVNQLPADPGLAMDEPIATIAPDVEPGWVLVDEDIWTELPDSAGRHLHNVYEAFLQHRSEQAATEIHLAIFDLELQAGRATGEDRDELMGSIQMLEGLLVPHDPVRASLELSRQRYDHAIAGASYALARHHLEMAEADWAAGLDTSTGYDLKWAASYLARGRVWARQTKDESAESHLRDARRLSDALIAGKTEGEANVSSRIEALEQVVMNLRTALLAMAR